MTPQEATARVEALEEMMTNVSGNMATLAPAVRDRLVCLEARVARLEAHDLRAALRCQQEASEGLAHLYELLTAKVRTLEGLLLTVATALENHLSVQHRLLNEDVSSAVELLREAQGCGS